jgi:membrane protein YqaA with SNARE-associated domain
MNIQEKIKRLAGSRWTYVVAVLFIVALSASLYFLVGQNPEIINYFTRYGYPGAFLISLIGNASVFVFLGATLPVLASLGAIIYPTTGIIGPVSVGLLGGLGAGIGEMVGYCLGYSGRGLVKDNRRFEQFSAWVKRWEFLAIFVFSLFPFVFDLVAITAGILHVPLWKYFLAVWAGRTILYVTVIVITALGLQLFFPGL